MEFQLQEIKAKQYGNALLHQIFLQIQTLMKAMIQIYLKMSRQKNLPIRQTRSTRGYEPPPKCAKVIEGHILAESNVAVVEEMRASHKDRQEGIETRGEQEVIAALE